MLTNKKKYAGDMEVNILKLEHITWWGLMTTLLQYFPDM